MALSLMPIPWLLLFALFLNLTVTSSDLRGGPPPVMCTNSANSWRASFMPCLYACTRPSIYTTPPPLANAARVALTSINWLCIIFLFCNRRPNYYLGSSTLVAFLLRRSFMKLYLICCSAALSTRFPQLIVRHAVVSFTINLSLLICNNIKLAKICCRALAIMP
jgi:hypothetical protein